MLTHLLCFDKEEPELTAVWSRHNFAKLWTFLPVVLQPEMFNWKKETFLFQNIRLTPHNYFTNTCLTEDSKSSGCNYTVRAISYPPCAGWTHSRRRNPGVRTPKPRGRNPELASQCSLCSDVAGPHSLCFCATQLKWWRTSNVSLRPMGWIAPGSW